MRGWILFLALLHLGYSSCPEGYNLVKDGQCRGFAAKMSASYETAFDKAVTECDKIDGLPIIIHNEEEQNYWMQRKNQIDDRFILGMICNTTTRHAEWMDGSPIDYIPPDGGIDDLNYCYPGCSWDLHYDGHYHSLCEEIVAESVMFCTKQLEQPVPSADGCDGFADDKDDGVCYQIGTTPMNWQDAQKTCKGFGADLASIHNSQENTFIRRLAVSRGAVNGVFLGGKSSGKLYGWSDGSDWDFANFKQGFPSNGLGDCLAMDTQRTSGDWVNTNCSSAMPFACERSSKNHTCSSGPWAEEQIITSPGFPFDASIPCEYTFTVTVGKRVEVEIIALQANECCDQVILVEPGTDFDEEIARLSGEISDKVYKTKKSNVMKVSWNPNGGVNVKGFMITYRAI